MQLTTLKNREREYLITIYESMNNLQERLKKYLIMKRKGEARYLRGQEDIVKMNLLEWQEKIAFLQRNIDTVHGMNWKKSYNGKECTTTEGKTTQIQIWRQNNMSVNQALNTTTVNTTWYLNTHTHTHTLVHWIIASFFLLSLTPPRWTSRCRLSSGRQSTHSWHMFSLMRLSGKM